MHPDREFRTIHYVLPGVATMASAEFQGNVLLRHSIVNFFLALLLYAVLSLIACAIGRRVTNDLSYYVGGGLFGLVVLNGT